MIESIATIVHHRHDPINTMTIHYIKDMGGLPTHVRIFRNDWDMTPQ